MLSLRQFIKPATPQLPAIHPSFGTVNISNAYLSSLPGHHGEPHLFSMGLREISRATNLSVHFGDNAHYNDVTMSVISFQIITRSAEN